MTNEADHSSYFPNRVKCAETKQQENDVCTRLPFSLKSIIHAELFQHTIVISLSMRLGFGAVMGS